MRRVLLLLPLLASGCASVAPAPVANPLFVPVADRDVVYDQVVAVIDSEFEIEREERVRLEGNVLTEGRIDTFPQTGSTIFEPWLSDSADGYEKLEGTLQSIRRWSTVRVIPTGDGFLIDLAVFKELEDVRRPQMATAGAATLREDTSLVRLEEVVTDQPINRGWIPLGRDAVAEQRLLQEIHARLGQLVIVPAR
jgi:hypothetical protein